MSQLHRTKKSAVKRIVVRDHSWLVHRLTTHSLHGCGSNAKSHAGDSKRLATNRTLKKANPRIIGELRGQQRAPRAVHTRAVPWTSTQHMCNHLKKS
jgi:hypothetical protein